VVLGSLIVFVHQIVNILLQIFVAALSLDLSPDLAKQTLNLFSSGDAIFASADKMT
jgi:hypothetical protein